LALRNWEEGQQEGIGLGALPAKRGTIVRQMRNRFGVAPVGLESRLDVLDEAALDQLLDRIVVVANADEFMAGL